MVALESFQYFCYNKIKIILTTCRVYGGGKKDPNFELEVSMYMYSLCFRFRPQDGGPFDAHGPYSDLFLNTTAMTRSETDIHTLHT